MSHSNDMATALPDDVKKLFLAKYAQIGGEKFYQFLVDYGTNRLNKGELQPPTPEMEMISYHDKFLSLARREHNEEYREIAKLCRRAAHRVYRLMLEVGLTEPNPKFLALVVS